MDKTYPSGLMWFRRDLRCDDNAALYQALKACAQVHCVFVFDRSILDALPREDRRVEFIRESLVALDADLRARCGHAGGGLIVRHAWAADELPRLAHELGVQAVFTNHDYEPQALARDAQVRDALAAAGVAFHTAKDQVIFERDELLTQAGLNVLIVEEGPLRSSTDFHQRESEAYPTLYQESAARKTAGSSIFLGSSHIWWNAASTKPSRPPSILAAVASRVSGLKVSSSVIRSR